MRKLYNNGKKRKSQVVKESTKKKISKAHKGRKFSEEHKKKLSKAKKGKSPWNKGKKGVQIAWNKGKKMSKEYRLKLSNSSFTTRSTSENKRLRMSVDFKDWRKKVFKRDDWTCRNCFKKGGKLHPHHIASFTKYSKLRFDTDNGITFCEKCHKLFHRIYGYKNFRSDSIILFLNY